MLDPLDLAIIDHLREDGRKSFTDIAAALGVSVSTVRNRYTRLTEENVIQVYGRVNPHRLGVIVYAQILLTVRPTQRLEAIAAEIATYPEVSFLALVTGEYDLEVNVMCRTNDHLNELVNERLGKVDGVYATRTNIYLRLVKAAQPDLTDLFQTESTATQQFSEKSR